MSIFKKIGESVVKLQGLSEDKKRVVFFAVISIAVLIVGAFGVISTKKNLSRLNRSLRSINLPSMELPQIDGERANIFDSKQLEELGDTIEELKKQTNETNIPPNVENFLDTGTGGDILNELTQILDNPTNDDIDSLDKEIQGF